MNTAMSNSNQIFSWGRFVAALRKELVEKRLLLVLIVVSMYLFYLVMSFMNNYLASEQSTKIADVQRFFSIYYGFIILACLVPSQAFGHLVNKAKRAQWLSSPASTVEKYSVNVLIYVIGFVAAFAACVELADLTRLALLKMVPILKPVPANMLTATIHNLVYQDPMAGNLTQTLNWTNLAGTVPMFLLASVIWPRWSVIKMYAAFQVFSILTSVIYIMYLVATQTSISLETIAAVNQAGSYSLFTHIVNVSLGVFGFVMSWFLFKRKDVISLKWWS